MSKSKVKTMLVVFPDSNYLVHKEFLPQGQTVNDTYYIDVAKSFKYKYENIIEFLTKYNVAKLRQPPYCSDLTP